MSKHLRTKHNHILRILADYDLTNGFLDIGERNRLTELIENRFDIEVQNTMGDLDSNHWFASDSTRYDFILCSHVIEHLCNPLLMLETIKSYLTFDGILVVCLPQRTKLLWTKIHFHEIDDYRIRILFNRAGFKVVKRIRAKAWREWYQYLKGVRPLLRLFLEKNSIYILRRG